MFRHTLPLLRRAKVTIPILSPTHTKAKIYKWCIDRDERKTCTTECYDPVFVLECSPDLVTEGYREHDSHQPLMIVESHEEGTLTLREDLELDTWYPVGKELGEIWDGEDDEKGDGAEWIWQAYSYEEPKD